MCAGPELCCIRTTSFVKLTGRGVIPPRCYLAAKKHDNDKVPGGERRGKRGEIPLVVTKRAVDIQPNQLRLHVTAICGGMLAAVVHRTKHKLQRNLLFLQQCLALRANACHLVTKLVLRVNEKDY